jgi:hypothetical protein
MYRESDDPWLAHVRAEAELVSFVEGGSWTSAHAALDRLAALTRGDRAATWRALGAWSAHLMDGAPREALFALHYESCEDTLGLEAGAALYVATARALEDAEESLLAAFAYELGGDDDAAARLAARAATSRELLAVTAAQQAARYFAARLRGTRDATALAAAAAANVDAGDAEQGLALAEQAVARDPAHLGANLSHARALVELERPDLAAAALEDALRRTPDGTLLRKELALLVLDRLDEPDRGLELLAESVRIAPEPWGDWPIYLAALADHGRGAEVVPALERLVAAQIGSAAARAFFEHELDLARTHAGKAASRRVRPRLLGCALPATLVAAGGALGALLPVALAVAAARGLP